MSDEKVYPRPPRISGASQRGLVAAMLLSTALSSITRDRLKSHTCARPPHFPHPCQARLRRLVTTAAMLNSTAPASHTRHSKIAHVCMHERTGGN